MIVLDKIRAFFKWYGKGYQRAIGFLEPEAKGAEKKAKTGIMAVLYKPEGKFKLKEGGTTNGLINQTF